MPSCHSEVGTEDRLQEIAAASTSTVSPEGSRDALVLEVHRTS